MPVFIKPIIVVIFLAYPFIIYYGLVNFALWQIALLVALLASIRVFIFKNSRSHLAKIGLYGSLFLLLFSLLSLILNENGWLKLYPIIMSLLSFTVFFISLYSDKTIIQRIAEIKEKNIDAKKQTYMFNLTIIWCVFFVINTIISTYTMLYMSLKYWSIYNGFVSYVVMGLLIITEIMYRHFFILRK